MNPIEFPQQTTVWAKNQPPYRPLPSYTDERETISLWRLTWRERFAVLFGRDLWLTLLTFQRPLQPIRINVGRPPHLHDLVLAPSGKVGRPLVVSDHEKAAG